MNSLTYGDGYKSRRPTAAERNGCGLPIRRWECPNGHLSQSPYRRATCPRCLTTGVEELKVGFC